MRWWSSDFHIGHYNVIAYSSRPVKNVNEMNEMIVNNWNSVVTQDDDMWFLGDFCMNHKYLSYLPRFNFHHMIWVLGNHDKRSRIERELKDGCLKSIEDKVTVIDECITTIDEKKFHVVHRPMSGSDECPSIVGHVHEKWRFLPANVVITEHSRNHDNESKVLLQPVLNVGVDVHNYLPINDEQILRFFNEQDSNK